MKLAKFPPGVPALDEFDLAFPPLWPTNRTPSSFRVPDQNWDQQDRPVRISSSSLDIPLKMGGGGAKKENWRQHVLKWIGSTREVLGELNCLPEERSEFWACVKLGNLPLSRIHYRWEQYELFSTMSHSIIPLFLEVSLSVSSGTFDELLLKWYPKHVANCICRNQFWNSALWCKMLAF